MVHAVYSMKQEYQFVSCFNQNSDRYTTPGKWSHKIYLKISYKFEIFKWAIRYSVWYIWGVTYFYEIVSSELN